MKRIVCLAAALCLAAAAAACTQGGAGKLPSAEAVYTGEIISIDGAYLLIAGAGERSDSCDLFSLSVDGLATKAGSVPAPGDTVEIGYSGSIMETYPATFSDPVYISVTEKSGSPISMYIELLCALYEDDAALNDGITYLAFDLDNCTNLTPAERNAVAWLLSGKYSLEPLTGSFGELADEGYVDKDNLSFPDGVILKITDTAIENGSFTFSASKWRSGDGAIGMEDCKATLTDGRWTYEEGSMWIS